MNDTAAVLQELASIRAAAWWIAALVGVTALAVSLRAAFDVSRRLKETQAKIFEQQAGMLHAEGKWEELLALCDEELAQKRNHTYAHWFKGLAHYGAGHSVDAKREFERVLELAPSWKEEVVGPYLRKVERRHD